jgi:hypothetical protein
VAPAAARGGVGTWVASRAGLKREWGWAWTGEPGHDRAISRRVEAADEEVVEGEEQRRSRRIAGQRLAGGSAGRSEGKSFSFFLREFRWAWRVRRPGRVRKSYVSSGGKSAFHNPHV